MDVTEVKQELPSNQKSMAGFLARYWLLLRSVTLQQSNANKRRVAGGQ